MRSISLPGTWRSQVPWASDYFGAGAGGRGRCVSDGDRDGALEADRKGETHVGVGDGLGAVDERGGLQVSSASVSVNVKSERRGEARRGRTCAGSKTVASSEYIMVVVATLTPPRLPAPLLPP